MRHYGRFVPHSTIMRRMDQKDARIARETAARQRKLAAQPRCAVCQQPSASTLCAGCTFIIELEG